MAKVPGEEGMSTEGDSATVGDEHVAELFEALLRDDEAGVVECVERLDYDYSPVAEAMIAIGARLQGALERNYGLAHKSAEEAKTAWEEAAKVHPRFERVFDACAQWADGISISDQATAHMLKIDYVGALSYSLRGAATLRRLTTKVLPRYKADITDDDAALAGLDWLQKDLASTLPAIESQSHQLGYLQALARADYRDGRREAEEWAARLRAAANANTRRKSVPSHGGGLDRKSRRRPRNRGGTRTSGAAQMGRRYGSIRAQSRTHTSSRETRFRV